MPDFTQEYIAQGIGGITNALKDAMDPRTQIALQAARRDAELHPLRQQKYQSDISLSGARALTEGERMALYKAQADDQAARTNFRNMFGNASFQQGAPMASPVIDNASDDFNTGVMATPGAAAALGMNPALPTPVGAMAADGYQQPNPLLPPLNGPAPSPSNYNYQDLARMARMAAATADNPNPVTLIEALAKAQALSASGYMTEDQARGIALAQGLLPNVNTAVTTPRQDLLLGDKYANAVAINDARNAALMERTRLQQQGAIEAARAKVANGGNVSFSDRMKIQGVAKKEAYDFFGIPTDEDGNVTQPGIKRQILAQAEQLALRTSFYMEKQQLPSSLARAQASNDLFGSTDATDPTYFNPAQDNWWTPDQPISAKTINQDAAGAWDRTGSTDLNGPSTAGDAMKSGMLGIGGQQQPAVFPPMLPGLTPTNEFALRPSNKEVEQRKKDQSEIADLQAQVAQIEANVRAGKIETPKIVPSSLAGAFGEYGMEQFSVPNVIDLNKDPDARNKLIVKRKELIEKINALQSKIGIAPSMGDIQRLYAP